MQFIEELILLTMSPVERGVYDRTMNAVERRKLCCHLQIANRIQCVAGVQQKSLEEVRMALVDHNQKVLIHFSTEILLICANSILFIVNVNFF